MAVISKIRKQSGLLIGTIGIAMLLFVGGDILNSGGGQYFGGGLPEVGEINGNTITYEQFEKEVAEFLGEQSVSADQMDGIRSRVWNRLVQMYILNDQYKRAGIRAVPEELFDQLKNSQGNTVLTQYFTNPQTGAIYDQFKNPNTGGLDNDKVLYYAKQVLNSDPKQWMPIEEAMKQDALSEKYNHLIRSGLYTTNLQAKNQQAEGERIVSGRYVSMTFEEINQEDVPVSEEDLKAYYNKHKDEKEYEQKETMRTASYIRFRTVPSDQDLENINLDLTSLIDGLANAEDDTLFVTQNSDLPNDIKYINRGELTPDLDSTLMAIPEKTVIGPYTTAGNIVITKKLAVQMMSDSVNARHILVSLKEGADSAAVKAKADSIMGVVNNANFAELAQSLSEDLGSATNGGNLDWFTRGRMVPEFEEACFNGKKGDITMALSQFGYHIIEILDQTTPREKIMVANVSRRIQPGEKTFDKVYQKASAFAIQNNTLEAVKAATESNSEIIIEDLDYIKEEDKTLSDFENPRAIIRWLYEAAPGAVSSPFESGNDFVVVALKSIKNKGVLPFEEVKDKVEEKVLKEKKAAIILEKLNGFTSIEDAATRLGKTAQQTQDNTFNSFTVNGIGPEPKVQGVLFALPKGKVSQAIVGENGVYVVEVLEIREPSGEADYAALKDQIASQMESRSNYEVFEALKEKLGVEDNRSKFY
jgi:peptidyl-prolyl cis-trans isomerase D